MVLGLLVEEAKGGLSPFPPIWRLVPLLFVGLVA